MTRSQSEATQGGPEGAERSTLRLFFKHGAAAAARRPGRLARLFGLHVYSGALLVERARIDMNFAAILLVIVGLFELCAWSFLFNSIFNADLLHLGLRTLWAVLIGCLFACVVFWFERQMLTHDEIRGWRSWSAVAIRLVYIGAAAFITAQPIELLAFRLPIAERVHAEAIREKAAITLGSLLQEENEDAQQTNLLTKVASDNYARAQNALTAAQEARTTLQMALVAKEGEIQEMSAQIGYIDAERKRAAALEREGANDLNSGYRQLVGRRQTALQRRAQLRGQPEVLSNEINRLTGEVKDAKKELEGLGRDTLTRRQMDGALFRQWVETLRTAKPGTPVLGAQLPLARSYAAPDRMPIERATRWSFREPQYSFFEQMRVLLDLVANRPPRWLTGSSEVVRKLETEYGLRSPRPCSTTSAARTTPAAQTTAPGGPTPADLPCDPREWDNEVARSAVYSRSYFAVFLMAGFIPLLVLTIKLFLLPQELRSYYSRRHQAAAGDADALLGALVEEAVHGTKATDAR